MATITKVTPETRDVLCIGLPWGEDHPEAYVLDPDVPALAQVRRWGREMGWDPAWDVDRLECTKGVVYTDKTICEEVCDHKADYCERHYGSYLVTGNYPNGLDIMLVHF